MNRQRLRVYFRFLAILIIYIFILQQYFTYRKSDQNSRPSTLLDTPNTTRVFSKQSLNEQRISRLKWYIFNQSISEYDRSVSEIAHNFFKYNRAQYIHNANIFEPLKNDSIVIIVQVHKNINALRYLIDSLSKAKYISKVLLIFSHDYYDCIINAVIETINFCKVMQIFYPYSTQLYANEFPGTNPNDCPRNVTKVQALVLDCNNALYPDILGHYREAYYAQQKHHWWWQTNRVFDQLRATQYFTGLVLFLEATNYVAEDFLHVLEMLKQSNIKLCPHCNIIALGYNRSHIPNSLYQKKFYVDKLMNQYRSLAFNRTTWLGIKECTSAFCHYDDYNWDRSLLYVSESCLQQKLTCMAINGPRVFNISNCPARAEKTDCSSRTTLYRVKRILRFARNLKSLFPPFLNMTRPFEKNMLSQIVPAAGDWADPRDFQLCLKMSQENIQIMSSKTEH